MSMDIESACEGSTAGRASQHISIENGRSLAGMKPAGMSARDANATSMMPAMSVCLFRLQGAKRISQGAIIGVGLY